MDQNISGILIELFVTIKYIVHLNMTTGRFLIFLISIIGISVNN